MAQKKAVASKAGKSKQAPKAAAKAKPLAAAKSKEVKSAAKPVASKSVNKAAEKTSNNKPVPKQAAAKHAAKTGKAASPAQEEISTAEPRSILKAKPAEVKAKTEKTSKASNEKATVEIATNLSKDDVNPQWYDFYKKNSAAKASPYDMRAQFEAHQPLMHKTLGWGWIMSNENDRLEVMFKDGKRMLISNYKPS